MRRRQREIGSPRVVEDERAHGTDQEERGRLAELNQLRRGGRRRLPQREQPALFGSHSIQGRADLAHQPQPVARAGARSRRLGIAGLAQLDAAAQERQSIRDEAAQLRHRCDLARIVADQRAQRFERRGQLSGRIAVRREVALVPGQEIAALSGLGAPHQPSGPVDLDPHLEGVAHPRIIVAALGAEPKCGGDDRRRQRGGGDEAPIDEDEGPTIGGQGQTTISKTKSAEDCYVRAYSAAVALARAARRSFLVSEMLGSRLNSLIALPPRMLRFPCSLRNGRS